MKVIATVDGYSLADSARVWVMPCLIGDSTITGDATIDDPWIRSALNAQQDTSKIEALERGGVIVRNLTTGRDSLFFLSSLSRGACFVSWPGSFGSYPGYKVVSFWHTHWVPNNYNCTTPSGETYPAGKGLSRGDWNSSYVLKCPLYTVDDKHIWRINPTTLSNDALWGSKRPKRELERNPGTTKCVNWPAWLPGDDASVYYTC